MEKRTRSPNYPAISLPDAIEKVTTLYQNQHTHGAPREVAVKSMGYNSLNGASATAISALHKYGLLDREGDEVKVSQRALRILHPHTPEERVEAVLEAASLPPLFVDLAERFPGRLPNEEVLRNYLLRTGFAPRAVSSVILSYRETSDFVQRIAGDHLPQSDLVEETAVQPKAAPVADSAKSTINQAIERQLGRYDFEDGGYVQIVAGGKVDTESALDMLETIIALKRKEIERRKAVDSLDSANAATDFGIEPENSSVG